MAFALTVPVSALDVDSKLNEYKAVSGVSGNIKSIGSDTLNNLMTLWSEGFRSAYPSVKIKIEGKGSSTAPPALIEGTAQFGPMSREMKSKEMEDFEQNSATTFTSRGSRGLLGGFCPQGQSHSSA